MPSVFSRIISGEIPGCFVFRGEHWVGILDLFPVKPGHLLLIPRHEAALVQDLPPAALADLGPAVARASACLRKALGCAAVTVKLNDGKAAGQDVPHCHVHCIPRDAGDGAHGCSPGRYGVDDASARKAMVEMAARLAGAW